MTPHENFIHLLLDDVQFFVHHLIINACIKYLVSPEAQVFHSIGETFEAVMGRLSAFSKKKKKNQWQFIQLSFTTRGQIVNHTMKNEPCCFHGKKNARIPSSSTYDVEIENKVRVRQCCIFILLNILLYARMCECGCSVECWPLTTDYTHGLAWAVFGHGGETAFINHSLSVCACLCIHTSHAFFYITFNDENNFKCMLHWLIMHKSLSM